MGCALLQPVDFHALLLDELLQKVEPLLLLLHDGNEPIDLLFRVSSGSWLRCHFWTAVPAVGGAHARSAAGKGALWGCSDSDYARTTLLCLVAAKT